MFKQLYILPYVLTLFLVVNIPQAFASCDTKCNEDVYCITKIGEKGLKIKKSGVYTFANDICVELKKERAAITIDANNVVLDLNNFTLKQIGCGLNNVGICVKPNRNGIIIKNGNISHFLGFGVRVGEGVQLIELKNLIVKFCGKNGKVLLSDNNDHTGGILFLGTLLSPIRDVTLTHCQAINNSTTKLNVAISGLIMSDVEKVSIRNSHFCDNFGLSEIAVVGAEFFHSKNVVIENSSADQNTNLPASGINAGCFGFLFNERASTEDVEDSIEHSNIKITSCTANNTLGKTLRAAGFRFLKVRNIVVENSESQQTFNTLVDPLIDPIVLTTATAAAGFIVATCDDFSFRNCTSHEHMTTNASARIVAGFDVSSSNFGLLTRCQAARSQNLGTGLIAGFIIEPVTARLDFLRSTGVVFEKCLAEDHNPGVGFLIFRAQEAKIIESEAIDNEVGILVGELSLVNDNTIQSIIKDNQVFSNTIFGILDNSGSNSFDTNAYLGNVARNNGPNPVVNNFNIPLGNPIVHWILSAASLPPTNDPVDNISIE